MGPGKLTKSMEGSIARERLMRMKPWDAVNGSSGLLCEGYVIRMTGSRCRAEASSEEEYE